MILALIDLKSNAKNLKKALEALGTTLTHSTALNLSSQGFGFKDYNTAKAILMDKKPAVVDLFEYEDAISVLNYKLENHAYYFQDKENIKEFISALRNKLNDEDQSNELPISTGATFDSDLPKSAIPFKRFEYVFLKSSEALMVPSLNVYIP